MRRIAAVGTALWLPGPVRSALVALLGMVGLYLVAFPYRTDYAAHAAGGFGLVVLFLAVGRLSALSTTSLIVGSVGIAWGIVIAMERTVTGPRFDAVDVSLSMLGAVVAGASLLERPTGRSETPLLVALGVLAVLLAVGLRYGSRAIV